MKKYLVLFLLTAISLLAVPSLTFTCLSAKGYEAEEQKNSGAVQEISFDTIDVFNSDEGTAQTLDFREYIIGVVAAEMPAEFHEEALSAGAVAAATFARKKIMTGADSSLAGAVISTDSAKHQAYMDETEMRERWGDKFDEYYKKLTDAVDKAIDYSITYNGELIVAAYHSISPGMTEDAENIWGGGYSYLKSVDSTGDKLSPKYKSEEIFTFDEFKNLLKDEDVTLPEDTSLWFSDAVYSEAGTLLCVNIGDKNFTGVRLREIFSLRSAAITPTVNDSEVCFSVKGYGHGVGMSQYGADYLARQGYSWQEIIKHYYTGVEIEIL